MHVFRHSAVSYASSINASTIPHADASALRQKKFHKKCKYNLQDIRIEGGAGNLELRSVAGRAIFQLLEAMNLFEGGQLV